MDDLEYIFHKYAQSLRHHIECVVYAGAGLGLPVNQLQQHDVSKWSKDEFFAYAMKFSAGIDNPAEFSAAWLHHIHNNPHHWQHWLIPATNEALFMPETDALEMLADWMGASLAYQGTLNMKPWLEQNLCKVILHRDTAQYVGNRLVRLGYDEGIVGLLRGWKPGV